MASLSRCLLLLTVFLSSLLLLISLSYGSIRVKVLRIIAKGNNMKNNSSLGATYLIDMVRVTSTYDIIRNSPIMM